MDAKVILTGIRANSDLHIGNYFGAIAPMVDLANKKDNYQINLFIPDLHSITTEVNFTNLRKTIINNLAIFVAAGLPIQKEEVFIYRQSYIPAHSELTWILNCFSSFGELERMTQFKDKSRIGKNEKISVGLFDYPILMAADILLYLADYVPVGEDQTQHLEFTRDIAIRFNNKFGKIFKIPKDIKSQHKFFQKDQDLRIKNLTDPSKKMSKSDQSSKGVIFINDPLNEVENKVMSAQTDSIGQVNYDKDKQPGISNLIEILAVLNKVSPFEIEKKYKKYNYMNFKKETAMQLVDLILKLQKNIKNVDNKDILTKLDRSEKQMNAQANKTLLNVQKAVGLR